MATVNSKLVDHDFMAIDRILGSYYQKQKAPNYFDKNADGSDGIQKGKFLQFIKDQALDDIPINDELGENCDPTDCSYTAFDLDNFPLNYYIDDNTINDNEKEIVIFYILQFCHKYGSMPQKYYIKQKLNDWFLKDKNNNKLNDDNGQGTQVTTSSVNNDNDDNKSDKQNNDDDIDPALFDLFIFEQLANDLVADNQVTDDVCTGDIKTCHYVHKIKQLLSKYDKYSANTIESDLNIKEIMNNFNHLLYDHNDDNDIEYIVNQLNECDISKCDIINRHYRRDNNLNTINNNDMNISIHQQICCEYIDKIHCYFLHCYDAGFRLRLSENKQNDNDDNKTNNIKTKPNVMTSLMNKTQEIFQKYVNFKSRYSRFNQMKPQYKSSLNPHKMNPFSQYSFGEVFYYWDWYKNSNRYDWFAGNKKFKYSERYVTKKYNSLQDELLNNNICFLSKILWDIEYEKAMIAHQSDYSRQNLIADLNKGFTSTHYANPEKYGIPQNTYISIEHLIAVSVYCGYSDLSRLFSGTFRYKPKPGNLNNKKKKQITKPVEFTNIISLGLSLLFPNDSEKEAFKRKKEENSNFYHLSKYLIEAINVFSKHDFSSLYHGIDTECVFDEMQCYMSQPFSATNSFEVAKRFSANSGMILEVGCASHAKGFDCAWVSKYSAEREFLFMCTSGTLALLNVTNTKLWKSYELEIKSLCILFEIRGFGTNQITKIASHTLSATKLFIIKCIKYRLNKIKYKKLDKYITLLFNNICDKKQYLLIDFQLFKTGNNYEFLKYLLFYKQCDMVNMNVLTKLFPNIKLIGAYNVPNLTRISFQNILQFAMNNTSPTLFFPIIVLNINTDPTDNDLELIKEYSEKFKEYNWFVSKWSYKEIPDLIKTANVAQEYIKISKYFLSISLNVAAPSLFQMFKF